MKITKIYDNPDYADRYTIYTNEVERVVCGKKMFACLGLSDNPTSPLGFSQWSSGELGSHNGKLITLDALPEDVKKHALRRILG